MHVIDLHRDSPSVPAMETRISWAIALADPRFLCHMGGRARRSAFAWGHGHIWNGAPKRARTPLGVKGWIEAGTSCLNKTRPAYMQVASRLVPLAGIEPTAYSLGESRSIQLSYRGPFRQKRSESILAVFWRSLVNTAPRGAGLEQAPLGQFPLFPERAHERSDKYSEQDRRCGKEQDPPGGGQRGGQ